MLLSTWSSTRPNRSLIRACPGLRSCTPTLGPACSCPPGCSQEQQDRLADRPLDRGLHGRQPGPRLPDHRSHFPTFTDSSEIDRASAPRRTSCGCRHPRRVWHARQGCTSWPSRSACWRPARRMPTDRNRQYLPGRPDPASTSATAPAARLIRNPLDPVDLAQRQNGKAGQDDAAAGDAQKPKPSSRRNAACASLMPKTPAMAPIPGDHHGHAGQPLHDQRGDCCSQSRGTPPEWRRRVRDRLSSFIGEADQVVVGVSGSRAAHRPR